MQKTVTSTSARDERLRAACSLKDRAFALFQIVLPDSVSSRNYLTRNPVKAYPGCDRVRILLVSTWLERGWRTL